MTVAQLVAESGVTTTAVRQQVYRLLLEGLVVRTKRRQGPGRPADVISVSERGRQLFGGHSDELCRLLMEEISEREGPERAREILRGVSRRIARQTHPMIGSGPLRERLRKLAALWQEHGLLVDVDDDLSPSGLRLTVFTCPYPDLADGHREICEMERESVSELVGSRVTLDSCLLDGGRCCRFSVVDATTQRG